MKLSDVFSETDSIVAAMICSLERELGSLLTSEVKLSLEDSKSKEVKSCLIIFAD